MRTKLQSDANQTPVRCERNSNPMRIGLKFSPNEITIYYRHFDYPHHTFINSYSQEKQKDKWRILFMLNDAIYKT